MKLNADIFIPVRLHSKRLPAKHLRLINGEPALLKLIRRLKRCKKTRKIVVCTTTKSYDDKLVHFLEKESILYYRGSLLLPNRAGIKISAFNFIFYYH